MAQVKLYSAEISKAKHEEFKTAVLSGLYGSRGDTEAIDKVLSN